MPYDPYFVLLHIMKYITVAYFYFFVLPVLQTHVCRNIRLYLQDLRKRVGRNGLVSETSVSYSSIFSNIEPF